MRPDLLENAAGKRPGNRRTRIAIVAECVAVIAVGIAAMLIAIDANKASQTVGGHPGAIARSVPSGHRLVVTLRYHPAGASTATLLSFPRNRLSLVDAGNGQVAVNAGDRRALTLAAAPGADALRV